MNRKILVVDDDQKISELIRLYLEKDHYQVLVAHEGLGALELARHKRPDLVVLDLMLPGLNGLDLCRLLRAEGNMPIIMVTARSTEDDKLIGLDVGADDYMTKPFSPRELVARVRALLRRAEYDHERPKELRLGALALNLTRHEAELEGQPVRLTPKEFKLLELLMREPGRVFSRLEILEKVFGNDYGGLERTVDVHIMNLRRKIEANPVAPDYIQTVHGVGYKLLTPENAP